MNGDEYARAMGRELHAYMTEHTPRITQMQLSEVVLDNKGRPRSQGYISQRLRGKQALSMDIVIGVAQLAGISQSRLIDIIVKRVEGIDDGEARPAEGTKAG